MTDTTSDAQNTGGGEGFSAASFWAAIQGTPLFIFWICLMGWMLSNLDQSLFGYAIPGIAQEFGAGFDTIGLILSGGFAAGVVSAVITGILADKYGRKPVFVTVLGLSAFLVGLQAFAPNLTVLAILRIAGFAVSVGLGPLVITYCSEAAPARYRGLMTGLLQSGYPLGWFLAALLAAPLTEAFGWRSTFWPAFAVVPIALLLIKFLPESKRYEEDRAARAPEDKPKISELLNPVYRRRSIFGFILHFCMGGAYAGSAFYFPTFLVEVRGFTQSTATLLVGLSYGLGVIGYISSSFVGEYYMTRRNTIALWLFIGGFALTGLIWIPETMTGIVIWFTLMAAFFYGTNAVMGTFLSEVFPTRLRGTGAAIVGAAALNLGFCVFPVVVSQLAVAYGWQMAFTIGTVPLVFLGALAVLGVDNYRSGQDLDEVAK